MGSRWNSRQLHHAGPDGRHRRNAASRSNARSEAQNRRASPATPLRNERRTGGLGIVPVLERCGLHHRRRLHLRWRTIAGPIEPQAGGGELTVQTSTLIRQLGIASASALVISNMIGAGIWSTPGVLAGQLGSAGLMLLVWAVGAVCALAGAFCYSELGVNFPSSGGEYVYLTQAYGPTWGFMSGWVSFFAGFSAPIAAAALAFSGYLAHFFPVLDSSKPIFTIGSGDWTLSFGWAQMAACGLVLVFTLINIFGVLRVAKLQNVLTSVKLMIVLGFVVLGFAFGSGSWSHFSQPAVRTSTVSLPTQFIVSLLWVMVGYSGWNAATYVAEEIRRPE